MGTFLLTVFPSMTSVSSQSSGSVSVRPTLVEKHSDLVLWRSTPWKSQNVSHIPISSCIAGLSPVVQVASSMNMLPIISTVCLMDSSLFI